MKFDTSEYLYNLFCANRLAYLERCLLQRHVSVEDGTIRFSAGRRMGNTTAAVELANRLSKQQGLNVLFFVPHSHMARANLGYSELKSIPLIALNQWVVSDRYRVLGLPRTDIDVVIVDCASCINDCTLLYEFQKGQARPISFVFVG